MQTINKGNGSGTGDSVKQALMKSADNFVEVSDRLDDIEARGFPRKLRGWGGPAAGFPQPPSAKGSAWTGAARVGTHSFAAGTLSIGALLPMPSGKLLAIAGLGSALYAQLYSVNGAGALTALGGVVQLQSGTSTGDVQAIAIGPDLAVVLVASGTGTAARRFVLDLSTGAIVISSDTGHARFNTARASFNPRGIRGLNTLFGVFTEYTSTSGAFCGAMCRQSSALAAETAVLDVNLERASGVGFYAATTHDLLGSDSAIVLTSRLGFDGAVSSEALLVAVNDRGPIVISRKILGAAATSNPSAIALSDSRAIVRPSAAAGAFTVDVVDGELQLLTTDIQTSGILGRTWRGVCAQDAVRAVVFEQFVDTAVPTVIQVNPATGAITEANTLPLVFGTSGTASIFDAVKIAPDRIAMIGKSASSSPLALVEVWDLS